jgi:uncharacterized protein YqhQ
VAIFFVGPLLLIGLVDRWIVSPFISNLLEGIIRLGFFLVYVWAIGFVPDIRRVFGYHGAEHKTINAYEAGDDLTVEAVGRRSTTHTRCGTAFLLQVVVISIFLFAVLGRPPMALRIVSRIVLVPVIAGIAYEFLKFTAARQRNRLIHLITMPGLCLQRLTTRQPNESMLEVAIAALQRLLTEEKIVAAEEQSAAGLAVSSVSATAADG